MREEELENEDDGEIKSESEHSEPKSIHEDGSNESIHDE